MEIIIKKSGSNNRFVPGYNIALGKVIHTSKDYVKELKSRNLEPYDPNYKQPEPKTYKPSANAHKIVSAIKNRTDKHGNVHMNAALHKEIGAYLPTKQDVQKLNDLNINSGGFNDGDKNFRKPSKLVSKTKK